MNNNADVASLFLQNTRMATFSRTHCDGSLCLTTRIICNIEWGVLEAREVVWNAGECVQYERCFKSAYYTWPYNCQQVDKAANDLRLLRMTDASADIEAVLAFLVTASCFDKEPWAGFLGDMPPFGRFVCNAPYRYWHPRNTVSEKGETIV